MAQSGLFVPRGPDPEKLELTVARLMKLVGDSNVGAAELIDTHRPENFRWGVEFRGDGGGRGGRNRESKGKEECRWLRSSRNRRAARNFGGWVSDSCARREFRDGGSGCETSVAVASLFQWDARRCDCGFGAVAQFGRMVAGSDGIRRSGIWRLILGSDAERDEKTPD